MRPRGFANCATGSSAALVAVGAGYGTLSAIALALRAEKRVVAVESRGIPGVESALDAEGAVRQVLTRPRRGVEHQ